jgi:hypothetical protein
LALNDHQSDLPEGSARPEADPVRQRSGSRIAVHLIWAVVVLALAAVPVYLWWSLRDSAESLREDVASTLRTAFQGDVTHRFYSSGPELNAGSGLQLASLRMSESFERTHVARFLGIEGQSQVRVDVPVTYHYQVPWDSGWRIVLTQGAPDSLADRRTTQICIVEAPALAPVLPPAIHSDELRIDRSKEWRMQRFDQATVDAVLREITPVTTRRAGSAEYKTLVRETARKRLKDFLRLWVLQLDEVPEETRVEIFVSFADDEPQPEGERLALFRRFEIR